MGCVHKNVATKLQRMPSFHVRTCLAESAKSQTLSAFSGQLKVLWSFSGPKGRRFKSCHLDHLKPLKMLENKGISGVLSYLGGAGCHSEIWPVWVHFGGIGCQNGGQNRFLYCFCQAIMECRRKILTGCLAGGQTVDWGLSTV